MSETETQEPLRMNAYYYAFSETGVRVVDEILSAVARAGKAYHHTEAWNDDRGGEPTYADLIQQAGDAAARALTASLSREAALVAERDEWKQVAQVEAGLRSEFYDKAMAATTALAKVRRAIDAPQMSNRRISEIETIVNAALGD